MSFKCMALNGQLGYGFTLEAFEEGMRRGPDMIGVDGGSNDPGPYYLGAGKSLIGRMGVKRDLSIALPAAVKAGIPLIIGSAGTGGAYPHVAWLTEIVIDVARDYNLSFRLATIAADVDKGSLAAVLEGAQVSSTHTDGDLPSFESIERCNHLVAQMGSTPFMAALDKGADVIIAGRACDTAIFAAAAVRANCDPALAVHMAKIAECGTHCSTSGSGADCLWVEVREDYFIVEPLNPEKACTPMSVAAHALYEQADPFEVREPEGRLDLTDARYTAVDARAVRVSGARYEPTTGVPLFKVEGSALVGYRTMALAGARDPVFISELDYALDATRAKVESVIGRTESWDLKFRIYGRDGVLGSLEPFRDNIGHEIGVVIEALAQTQDLADAICAAARSTLLHIGYPGRKSTAGNLAFPYSPSDVPLAPAYEFAINHLFPLPGDTLFPIRLSEIRAGTKVEVA